ncbi:hypothetical protein [Methylobacterium sp. JK268]
MGTMVIRDEALVTARLLDDADLVAHLRALGANETVILRVAGEAIRFRRLPASVDGSEPGLVPDSGSEPAWAALRRRRHGETVSVEIAGEGRPADPYLLLLSMTLDEWNSPEDAAAYDGL